MWVKLIPASRLGRCTGVLALFGRDGVHREQDDQVVADFARAHGLLTSARAWWRAAFARMCCICLRSCAGRRYEDTRHRVICTDWAACALIAAPTLPLPFVLSGGARLTPCAMTVGILYACNRLLSTIESDFLSRNHGGACIIVLLILDSTALMYYVFHIVRSRIINK